MTPGDGDRRRDRRLVGSAVLAVGLVALAVSPIVVGAFSLVGDTWYPAGDWSHFVFRVSQVGSLDTPLVGTYTVKGWAHPGPMGFWLAAPLYRLTGGDPRALQWTAAVVNVAVLACLAGVAWRRGRWPLLLAVTALVAVLVHGIGPQYLVDLWNPYLPLTSFLLTLFLVWDAALGRRRALLEAVLPATLAMQNHLAFVSLAALLAVWLYAWLRWWPRLLPDPAPDPAPASADGHGVDPAPADGHGDGPAPADGVGGDPDDPPTRAVARWDDWRPTVRRGLVLGFVLWLPTLVDALFDLHNPWNIARSFGTNAARVGPRDAFGLVGRYVRPDGPWMGGAEPRTGVMYSVPGSGPLPWLLSLAVLAGCLVVARRRRLVDVAALTTLSLVLAVGSVPAVAQIPMPNEVYLTQWLKVVGGLVWFTVAWTVWRVAAPSVRPVPARRRVVAALAVALTVWGAASTWGTATDVDLPLSTSGRQVQELVGQLDGKLPRDQVIRVDRRGEFWHIFGAGVFYALMEDGYDVVTDEGYAGLKWGHDRRYDEGDPYDVLITVAVDKAVEECAADPRSEQLAGYDWLSPEEREWLTDVQFRRLDGEDAITDAERDRALELGARDLRLAIFEGPEACATDPEQEFMESDGGNALALAAAGGAVVVVAAGVAAFVVLRRRRLTPSASPESPSPESEG